MYEKARTKMGYVVAFTGIGGGLLLLAQHNFHPGWARLILGGLLFLIGGAAFWKTDRSQARR